MPHKDQINDRDLLVVFKHVSQFRDFYQAVLQANPILQELLQGLHSAQQEAIATIQAAKEANSWDKIRDFVEIIDSLAAEKDVEQKLYESWLAQNDKKLVALILAIDENLLQLESIAAQYQDKIDPAVNNTTNIEFKDIPGILLKMLQDSAGIKSAKYKDESQGAAYKASANTLLGTFNEWLDNEASLKEIKDLLNILRNDTRFRNPSIAIDRNKLTNIIAALTSKETALEIASIQQEQKEKMEQADLATVEAECLKLYRNLLGHAAQGDLFRALIDVTYEQLVIKCDPETLNAKIDLFIAAGRNHLDVLIRHTPNEEIKVKFLMNFMQANIENKNPVIKAWCIHAAKLLAQNIGFMQGKNYLLQYLTSTNPLLMQICFQIGMQLLCRDTNKNNSIFFAQLQATSGEPTPAPLQDLLKNSANINEAIEKRNAELNAKSCDLNEWIKILEQQAKRAEELHESVKQDYDSLPEYRVSLDTMPTILNNLRSLTKQNGSTIETKQALQGFVDQFENSSIIYLRHIAQKIKEITNGPASAPSSPRNVM
jgi:hypothetical protein